MVSSRPLGLFVLTAQEIVTAYADGCTERRLPRIDRTVRKLAGIAKRELAAHPEIPSAAWIAAADRVAAGRPPEMLAELAVEAMGRSPSLRPSEQLTVDEEARQRVRDYIDEHGWPTGARFVRGTHSGAYVPDLWGTERPDDDGYYPHPSFQDLVDSMRERIELSGSAPCSNRPTLLHSFDCDKGRHHEWRLHRPVPGLERHPLPGPLPQRRPGDKPRPPR